MNIVKSVAVLATLIPSIVFAVPWCHKQAKLQFPSSNQSFHWTGTQLQNQVNNTNITCVTANNPHYSDGCKAGQALNKYCYDTYGAPNGLPTRYKWNIPNGGYNYSIASGATFQCTLCSDGRLLKLPRKSIKITAEMLEHMKKPVIGWEGSVVSHNSVEKSKSNGIHIKQHHSSKAIKRKATTVHSHNGRKHSHPLPVKGKSHRHGNGVIGK